MPLRLCYLERTFINNTSYQGRLKGSGADRCGADRDDSSDADAEILAMVIRALKAAGLTEFQVELGEVDFFRGLLEKRGMDEEMEERLRELIGEQELFRRGGAGDGTAHSQELKDAFLKLPELFGSLEEIQGRQEFPESADLAGD